MKLKILLTRRAKKSIDSLHEGAKDRILKAIRELPNFPRVDNVKKLRGVPGMYRARVGNYRILFSLEGNKIIIVNILPRSKAYKNI